MHSSRSDVMMRDVLDSRTQLPSSSTRRFTAVADFNFLFYNMFFFEGS
jgi:hypothetical protein